MFLVKIAASDGFYRIDLAPLGVPKLGLTFPQVLKHSKPDDQLVTLPLVFPIG